MFPSWLARRSNRSKRIERGSYLFYGVSVKTKGYDHRKTKEREEGKGRRGGGNEGDDAPSRE